MTHPKVSRSVLQIFEFFSPNIRTMKALIVEDMPDIQRGIYNILEDMDRFDEIRSVYNVQDAFKLLETYKPNYVHLDINLTGNENNSDGIALLNSFGNDTAVFVYTAMGETYAYKVLERHNVLFKKYKIKGLLTLEQLINEITELINEYEKSSKGIKRIKLQKSDGSFTSIYQHEFICGASNRRNCIFYTVNQIIEVKGLLGDLINEFNSPPVLRAGKSVIVNKNFYTRDRFKLYLDKEIKKKISQLPLTIDITDAYKDFWVDGDS